MKGSRLLIQLKSSLWFVPVLCVLAGAVLSFGTILLDRLFDYQAIPSDLVGGPDAAAGILSTVASKWSWPWPRKRRIALLRPIIRWPPPGGMRPGFLWS